MSGANNLASEYNHGLYKLWWEKPYGNMHFYQLVRNPLIETEHNEIDIRICRIAIFPIVGGKKKDFTTPFSNLDKLRQFK